MGEREKAAAGLGHLTACHARCLRYLHLQELVGVICSWNLAVRRNRQPIARRYSYAARGLSGPGWIPVPEPDASKTATERLSSGPAMLNTALPTVPGSPS